MGSIIRFPRGRRHGRASAGSARPTGPREASAVIIAAESPAACATAVASTADHQSDGMESRCHHFDTREALAPMSDAMASFDAQSSMIARNEVGPSVMPNLLGQSVLNCNDKTSYDIRAGFYDNVAMADRMSETEEKAAYIGRVRLARETKFKTQKPVYSYLGVEQGQYKHWETSREMPRKYIPKFCIITEVSEKWLLTGEGEGPAVIEIPKDVPQRGRKPQRARAA